MSADSGETQGMSTVWGPRGWQVAEEEDRAAAANGHMGRLIKDSRPLEAAT